MGGPTNVNGTDSQDINGSNAFDLTNLDKDNDNDNLNKIEYENGLSNLDKVNIEDINKVNTDDFLTKNQIEEDKRNKILKDIDNSSQPNLNKDDIDHNKIKDTNAKYKNLEEINNKYI